jgi:hypothetical protein
MKARKLLVIGVLSSFACLSQVQSGRIVGIVRDPNSAVVPNAKVIVTQTATSQARTVNTSDLGEFVITPLDPGMYSVEITAPGFEATRVSRVEVVVGESARVDVELRLGQATTTVEVSAQGQMLNTESATVGQQVTNAQIVDLPLNGREFHLLGQLAPGAVLLPSTGNTQLVRPEYVNGTVIGGVRGGSVTFLIDGVDVTEQHQGGTWIEASVDALQEFSVQQNAYSAEYKRAGGFFNAITKSGSNEFHGNLFEFLRNDKLDARNFFSPTRAILKRNQFGGTLGGPVIVPHLYNGKDKTFFFLSYQGTRIANGEIFNNIVPTAAQRTGDYSAPGLPKLYDPLTITPNASGSGATALPFSGNIIPTSRLSPQALFFLPYIPLGNVSPGTNIYTPDQPLRREQTEVRVDREITPRNKLFVRWNWHDNRQGDPSAYAPLGTTSLSGLADNVDVASTNNIRANMVHEFRYNYMVGNYRSHAYYEGTNFNQQAGITGLDLQDNSIATFPAISWSGYAAGGTGGLNGQANDGRPKFQDRLVHEFTDSLTWVKGKHIMKFGTDIRYFKILFTDTRNHVGSFNFNGVWTQNPSSAGGTGDAFADYLLGYPSSVTRSNPASWWGGYGTYWHFFFQDDFKVTSRLTLNLGLRYEYSPWLKGYRGQVATFQPSLAKPIIVAAPDGQIDLAAQTSGPAGYNLFGNLMQTNQAAGLPIAITRPNKLNFAPRLGFAWRLDNQTVVRGGYGIFYETENTDGRLNFNFLPWSISETTVATTNVVPTRTFANYFLGSVFGTSVVAPSWTPTTTFMPKGYDEHWSFGVQRQLLHGMLLEVNYVADRGKHLNENNTINDPTAGPGAIQARRPYPLFGPMSYTTQDVSSTYDSLQVKLERRFAVGAWFLVSYTFSKTIWLSNVPAVGGNFAWERALASFDVPHNLAISYGYQLPFGRSKQFLSNANRFVDAVVGGWNLSGIVVFHSHTPYTPTISRDVANIGEANQRPNRVCSGVASDPTLNAYFDKSCFTLPANYTFGNSGGGILRGDYLGEVDLALAKQFHLNERIRLDFRAEAFNLPNTAYFNNPGTNVDVASGGRVTSTSNNPRQLQFGVKMTF